MEKRSTFDLNDTPDCSKSPFHHHKSLFKIQLTSRNQKPVFGCEDTFSLFEFTTLPVGSINFIRFPVGQLVEMRAELEPTGAGSHEWGRAKG